MYPAHHYVGIESCHPLPLCLPLVLTDDNEEPTSYSIASKYPHWRNAMLNEFNALIKQITRSLVPASMNSNVVGCKWTFKIKKKVDGIVERHKACLVAKGYNQCFGIDFDVTFSLVVKPPTICLVLSTALNQNW